jgi:hypothetical protein
VLENKNSETSTLLMFTDGGPYHNCKHLSVQTALLALFLLGGMDTMVVLRTAPQQSWTNPAERIMSILNIGLQGCSLARTAMDEKFEVTMRKCNGMGAIRRAALDNMRAAKNSHAEQLTPQAASSLDAINIVQEMPLPDPANMETMGGVEASTMFQEQSLPVPISVATVGDGEASTIVLEQPLLVPIHAATMGGEESNIIVQELGDEALPLTIGSRDDLPEAVDGLDVVADDDDWMLDDDDVDDGYCETSNPITSNTIIEGVQTPPRVDASNDNVAPEPASNTRVISNARPADIPVYEDGNFEEVYAKSIATPLKIVENQFRQLAWNDTPLEVNQPATNQEVRLILRYSICMPA